MNYITNIKDNLNIKNNKIEIKKNQVLLKTLLTITHDFNLLFSFDKEAITPEIIEMITPETVKKMMIIPDCLKNNSLALKKYITYGSKDSLYYFEDIILTYELTEEDINSIIKNDNILSYARIMDVSRFNNYTEEEKQIIENNLNKFYNTKEVLEYFFKLEYNNQNDSLIYNNGFRIQSTSFTEEIVKLLETENGYLWFRNLSNNFDMFRDKVKQFEKQFAPVFNSPKILFKEINEYSNHKISNSPILIGFFNTDAFNQDNLNYLLSLPNWEKILSEVNVGVLNNNFILETYIEKDPSLEYLSKFNPTLFTIDVMNMLLSKNSDCFLRNVLPDIFFDDVVLLKHIILQNKFNLCSLFTKEAFTSEIVELLVISNNTLILEDKFQDTYYSDITEKFKFSSYNIINNSFDNVINTNNLSLIMLFLLKYKELNNNDDNLRIKYEKLLNKVRTSLINKTNNEEYVNMIILKILNKERNPFTLDFIDNEKELYVVCNIGDLLGFPDKDFIRLLPNTILDRINLKQIKEIYNLLKAKGYLVERCIEYTLKIYLTLGYERSRDFLCSKVNKSYGNIDIGKLKKTFSGVCLNDIIFTQKGNTYEPVLNTKLINILFGENYKVKNTPIKNFINDFEDKKIEYQNEIKILEKNSTLTEEEKRTLRNNLDYQYMNYTEKIHTIFNNLGDIIYRWDIIEEEYLKKTRISKLKTKLKIATIIEIYDSIRFQKCYLEARDYPLKCSDVFDYVGRDNQFTFNIEKTPLRVIELSRKMEGLYTKKIPNITVTNDNYKLFTYNPQDRNILSAGYKSGCCFRPNGHADDMGNNYSLLTYCATTSYGGGIEIRDKDNNTIMFSPVLRNGNVLMIHSIESTKLSDYTTDYAIISNAVHKLLKEYAEKVIEVSKKEEDNDAIIAVVVTNLHHLDKKYIIGTLPEDKKFEVFDSDNSYANMYNNLGYDHMILAFDSDKNINDIKYNDVSKTYDYPSINSYFIAEVSKEELCKINEIANIKNRICELSNQRNTLISLNKEEESYELLREIKGVKKEYLKLYKDSFRQNIDICSKYNECIEIVKYIDSVLDVPTLDNISSIKCNNNWYLAITTNGEIIGNYLPNGEKEFRKVYTDTMRLYGIKEETDGQSSKNVR